MPRPKKVIQHIQKNISLPISLVTQVDLLLWSDLEERVPFGAWQGYVTELIAKDLQERKGKGGGG